MSSPIEKHVISVDGEDYDLYWTDDISIEEINEMFGVSTANDANDADNSTSTSINTNPDDMDSAKALNKAADSEDEPEVILMMIDGKLHYREMNGHIRPVKATLEEIKKWVKDECQDTRKQDEWIKWLMEAPLDQSQFDGASMTPCSDIASMVIKKSLEKYGDS